jgi:hypothetical protein
MQKLEVAKKNYYHKNEVGNKYGKLLVIQEAGRSRNELLWECRCDCGNTIYVIGSSLRKGVTRSCGCLKYEYYRSVKGVKRSADGHSATTKLFTAYKIAAKRRGLEFSLSREQFVTICKSKCHYCGCEPYQVRHEDKCGDEFIYNGIDRVNNDLGYIMGNVVAACGVCNCMKRHHSFDFFKKQISKIYKRICLEGSENKEVFAIDADA